MGLKSSLRNTLPPPAYRLAARAWRSCRGLWPAADPRGEVEYQRRARNEQEIFHGVTDVHALPEIFHYWSNRYLRPMNETFGFSHPEHFFEVWLGQAHDQVPEGRVAHFASIGSGNCDMEVRMAQALVAAGRRDFVIDCIDLNDAMLERGMAHARNVGVEAHISAQPGDFNHWQPQRSYDAILANQSLHHVLNLEGLFDAISRGIGAHGLLITSDMIGRNGHMRWPEALQIVQEFWRELPDAYRYNRQLQEQQMRFRNWNCARDSFEGIRAQDILPLLVARFGFQLFHAWGNVIDPFIDRGIGHNFDAEGDWDRDFIGRVHARDEAEIHAGRIKPTHMLAVLCNDRSAQPLIRAHLTPDFCLRPPSGFRELLPRRFTHQG